MTGEIDDRENRMSPQARSKPALDLLEEAALLLRNAPASALAAYYAGTLPFLLAFLFFWDDMARGALAYRHGAAAAFAVAALFLWMSAWQGFFAQRLRSALTGSPMTSVRRIAFVQASLQPSKLILLPLAALATIPLGAVFAFYQNLIAVSYADARGLRGIVRSARRQAALWQPQSWTVLAIFFALAIVVFLNIGVLLLLIPQLLKSFLGIETALSRGETLLFNSTFLAITAALTYAVVDPLVKAVYVLRCHYGESLATGEDLRAQLQKIAAQALLVTALLGGSVLHAQPPPTQDLNRAIDATLKHPEFSWRLPHRYQHAESKSWVVRIFDSIVDKAANWLDAFFNWLHEHFRPRQSKAAEKHRMPAVRTWIYILIGAAIAICLILLVAAIRRRPRAPVAAETITAALPDFALDEALASQLPADEWLRTARECMARNDLRLALRALYLANLAYLGARSLVVIDRGKSNGDYARELRRRARSKPEILPLFSDTVRLFERAWYGMYDVTREQVAKIEENLASTRSYVEQ